MVEVRENHIKKTQKYIHNGSVEDIDNRIERLRTYIDEILINMKDADVLQHCLYNPLFTVMEHEKSRFQNLLTEFGISRRL